MKRIRLSYWNEPNFGDALSPYLIKKLTGKDIQYKELYSTYGHTLKLLLKYIFTGKIQDIRSIHFPFEANILAIGSILAYGNKHSIIWGSGFMNENEEFKGGRVFAVRGVYTDRKLRKMGYEGCSVYGDPALLLPLVLKGSHTKRQMLGIIPHWKETDNFIKEYSSKYNVIDLRTYDIESVVKSITECKYILSTSLHGIIVSHAYGIPALWIKRGNINTDGIKFNDYFSSVGIYPYKGFTNIDKLLSNDEIWQMLFEVEKNKTLPAKSISTIQQQLLEVAPFEVLEKYLVQL